MAKKTTKKTTKAKTTTSKGRPRPRTQEEVPGTEESRQADKQIDRLATVYLEAADEHGEVSARVKSAKAQLVGALIGKEIEHYVCKDGTKIDLKEKTELKVKRAKKDDGEDEAA